MNNRPSDAHPIEAVFAFNEIYNAIVVIIIITGIIILIEHFVERHIQYHSYRCTSGTGKL